ncbi:MAG TPA: response regulator transcription factor [Gemmatimonadaceae bacterium]|nr:response regulator transcription factor [Gemmatimonadaceae bacterium]
MTRHLLATSPSRIRVFLVADIRLYRDGIVQALTDNPDVEVVGAASPMLPDCEHHIQLAEPDVLLVEGSAIREDSLVTRLDAIAPGCRVVAFGVVDDEREVIHCVEQGVSGFISRDAGLDQLVEIIRSVARGEFSCSPRETTLLLKGVRSLTADRRPGAPPCLTVREQQVIGLVDNGLSNKDIAHRLGIELSTVKNHIHNILSKLHTTRRGEAAASVRRTSLESASRRQSARSRYQDLDQAIPPF